MIKDWIRLDELRPLLADRTTWFSKYKTVQGNPVELIAIQRSRRTRRRGKTTYVYRIGTNIFYNHSSGGVMYMPIAMPVDALKYYKIFVSERDSEAASFFRRINGYRLV